MQTELIILLVLLVIIIILLVFFRPKSRNDAVVISARIDSLQSGLKEDFLLNRKESAALSKENRMELNDTLRDFIAEQKIKFDELKNEQENLAIKTIEQLEKISTQVEARLLSLMQQDKSDSQLMRDALENAFKGFRDTFDKNVESFNNLQKEKFSQLDHRQTMMLESNERKLEEMRVSVDEKL